MYWKKESEKRRKNKENIKEENYKDFRKNKAKALKKKKKTMEIFLEKNLL